MQSAVSHQHADRFPLIATVPPGNPRMSVSTSNPLAADLRELIAQNRQLESRFSQLQRSIAAIRLELESAEMTQTDSPRRRARTRHEPAAITPARSASEGKSLSVP